MSSSILLNRIRKIYQEFGYSFVWDGCDLVGSFQRWSAISVQGGAVSIYECMLLLWSLSWLHKMCHVSNTCICVCPLSTFKTYQFYVLLLELLEQWRWQLRPVLEQNTVFTDCP